MGITLNGVYAGNGSVSLFQEIPPLTWVKGINNGNETGFWYPTPSKGFRTTPHTASPNAWRSKLSELVLQIVTMPADTNPNGKIFGGWVMAKMDQAASTICGLAAKNNWALGHYVTAAANNIVFHSPVEVGDILQCFAEITRTGKTSYTIQVNVHIKDNFETKVCEGEFIMVHIDRRGRPIPHTNSEPMEK